MTSTESRQLRSHFSLGLGKCSRLSDSLDLDELRRKEKFLEGDAAQRASRVRDLERTVVINKEIIAELLGSATRRSENANRRLNVENRFLHAKLREVRDQQCESTAKILILEQIIKEMASNEEESKREYQGQVQTLTNALSIKDQLLELQEARFKAIKKAINENEDTWDTANAITIQLKEISSSSKNADASARRLINEQLQGRVNNSKDGISSLPSKITIKTQAFKQKQEEFHSLKRQNEYLKKKVAELKSRVSELLIINERTSNELQKALYRLRAANNKELNLIDEMLNESRTTSTWQVSNNHSAKDRTDETEDEAALDSVSAQNSLRLRQRVMLVS